MRVKKGFTLIELLFVMAIISILAGFAIVNLQDSTGVAIVNSMKNDARNAISTQQSWFAENQVYDTVSCTEGVDDTNGQCIGENGEVFSISKGNSLSSDTITCDDGTAGLEVSVTNTQSAKIVTFNSCTDGAIQTNDI